MTLHVGMFVNYFSLVSGGAESYVADLSRELEQTGCRVTIVTGRSLFRKPRPARAGAEIIYEPCLYELRELGRQFPGHVDWLANVACESLYTLLARRHVGGFDIVHCHGYDTAAAALDSPRRRGPVLLTMHGPPTAKRRVGSMLRRLNGLISPSEWLRDQVREDHGVEATLLPMGVDLELFAPMERAEARRRLGWDDGPTVLFVGRLIAQKDVATLLRAFQIVAPRRRQARLKIAGGGVDESFLRRQAAALGISGSVDFLGPQPRESLGCFYAAADVVAMPSLLENFPMVALEALACGAPLVVSDSVREITRHFDEPALFPRGDHERLAARLVLGLDGWIRPVPREKLERFSWKGVAASYLGIYESLLTRSAA